LTVNCFNQLVAAECGFARTNRDSRECLYIKAKEVLANSARNCRDLPFSLGSV
jgi:hypothetical protein